MEFRSLKSFVAVSYKHFTRCRICSDSPFYSWCWWNFGVSCIFSFVRFARGLLILLIFFQRTSFFFIELSLLFSWFRFHWLLLLFLSFCLLWVYFAIIFPASGGRNLDNWLEIFHLYYKHLMLISKNQYCFCLSPHILICYISIFIQFCVF